MTHVSANSILPARRYPTPLLTEDGVRLVGEWSLPEDADPRAVIVFCHPLPTHGGSMDSHLIRKAGHLPCVEQPEEYARVPTECITAVGDG